MFVWLFIYLFGILVCHLTLSSSFFFACNQKLLKLEFIRCETKSEKFKCHREISSVDLQVRRDLVLVLVLVLSTYQTPCF